MARRPIVPRWPLGRYKLTEKAFIGRTPGADHELLEAGTEIVYDFMPGPHMEPLDPQAHTNVEHAYQQRGPQTLDPTGELSLIVGETDDIDMQIAQTMAHVEALKARRIGAVAQSSAPLAPPPAVSSTAPLGALMAGMPIPLNIPPPPLPPS